MEYEILGIKGITLYDDNFAFGIENEYRIESVKIILNDLLEISGLRVTFNNDYIIEQSSKDSVYKLVEAFVVKIILELKPEVIGLCIKISRIYNPNEIKVNDVVEFFDTISVTDSVSFTSGYPIEKYSDIFTQISKDNSQQDRYTIFFNIMKMDNLIIRYLMLYELLMSLISYKRKQKDITDYIRDKYNPTLSFNKIGFHATRRTRMSFDEDDITYYRNILAHSDVGNIDNKLEATIKTMIEGLIQVIYFAQYNHQSC